MQSAREAFAEHVYQRMPDSARRDQQIALLNQESAYSPREDEVAGRLVTVPGVWVVLSLVQGSPFSLSHRNVPAKAGQ